MKTFFLEVLTPERVFFSGDAELITVTGSDGIVTVLADHAPMLMSLDVGELIIKTGKENIDAFHSEGFMEITKGKVTVFCQSAENIEDIDIVRAENARQRVLEQLRHKQNVRENYHARITLTRATVRLRLKSRRKS